MAESLIVKNMRDGTLSYVVGANSYEFKFEQGNWTLQVPGPTVAVYLDRGEFGDPPQLRYDQDQAMSGAFAVYFRDTSSALYSAALEFITKTGVYASWGSSLGANAEVKTGTLVWTCKGIVHGDLVDKRIELPYCTLTGGVAEGNPNLINFAYTSYAVYPSTVS